MAGSSHYWWHADRINKKCNDCSRRPIVCVDASIGTALYLQRSP